MVKRAEDLKKIKAMLDAQVTPAPGTLGARCEKAISNGTFRPKRGELTCPPDLDADGNVTQAYCCAAARIYMTSGVTADAGWMTIETCQKAGTGKYAYQPPRAPMATEMPAKVEVDYTCIEGAKKLAAAASAVAAAVYMLA